MIDTEALRKKVIELAIQGKLTEQLPEDGNAEDLYAQIQEEKAKQIKEGKIKKEKPLPEIADDEVPFEIPSNWKWIRLCDISETNIGLTYHPENIVDNGTIVLRSNNIVNGTFDYSDLVRVNCTVRGNQYIRKNDILICSRNGSKRLVGKCAIYDGAYGDVSFGAFMAILRTPFFQYLYFFLLTDCFRRYFSNDDTKQINQVTQDILKKAIVPFPPYEEQKRIVEKLNDVLAQIDVIDILQQQYISDVEVLKGKIIDAGIRGKLTEQLPEDGNAEDLYAQIQEEKTKLIKEGKIKKEKPLPAISDDEIPFEIPENWKWVRLDGIVSKPIKRGKAPKYAESGRALVFAQKCNTKQGIINLKLAQFLNDDVYDKYPDEEFLNNYDIVINSTGTGTLGRVGIILNINTYEIVPDSHVTTIRVGSNMSAMFVYLYLKYMQPKIEEMGTGSTNQKELYPQIIRSIPVPIPPVEEQRRIVTFIESMLNQLTT